MFAYGQTGTGKTHTMEGKTGNGVPIEKDTEAGIIPRAMNALFDNLHKTNATEWSVRVSFLELYNEEIFDLLSGNDDHSKLRQGFYIFVFLKVNVFGEQYVSKRNLPIFS